MKPFAVLIYLLLLLGVVISAQVQSLAFAYDFVKPALMACLILQVSLRINGGNRRYYGLLIFALVFSLLGDVFLLPRFTSEYFLLGLLSFLAAHVMYIVLFLRVPIRPLEVPFLRRNPWMIFLGILYGGWMFTKVRLAAGDIAWAVAIYILVILSMALVAFNRQRAVSRKSFALVAIGALLFMLSDSFLAWNRFVQSLPNSAIAVMSTYGLAQLFITMGIIEQVEGD